jgi:predicted nucleic acid-binding protein
MIVVDTSVWINNLKNNETASVRKLRIPSNNEQALLGDLILLEILQGARSNPQSRQLYELLSLYPMVRLFDVEMVAVCAENYRILRSRGITIRKTIDVIIGTFCIVNDHYLLHDDRDFDAMATHLGLRVL